VRGYFQLLFSAPPDLEDATELWSFSEKIKLNIFAWSSFVNQHLMLRKITILFNSTNIDLMVFIELSSEDLN